MNREEFDTAMSKSAVQFEDALIALHEVTDAKGLHMPLRSMDVIDAFHELSRDIRAAYNDSAAWLRDGCLR